MTSKRERLDAFPTQLVLTIVWAGPITLLAMLTPIGKNLYFITLISLYAIVISHFTAHMAWRAKRAAQESGTTPDSS